VLIVGFSGWDDAITRALKNVAQFDQNLYWCDRNVDPEYSSLTKDARDILKAHCNSFYVSIEGADDLMMQLHLHLSDHALPHIFRNPILSARDQLDLCDLAGVKVIRSIDAITTSTLDERVSSSGGTQEDINLGSELATVRVRLDSAQDLFTGKTATDAVSLLAAQVRERLALATDLYMSQKYEEALVEFDFVIQNEVDFNTTERSLALFRRGVCLGRRNQDGDLELAIADFTTAISMPNTTAELIAKALINRGYRYGQRGLDDDQQRTVADYSTVINMSDAPAELKAMALVNRGNRYGQLDQRGDQERELADYTAVINMSDAPAEQMARALVNRGISYGQRGMDGDQDRAIADYTAVINLSDARAELMAKALINRGYRYGQRGMDGDEDREILDYTAVINMSDAPAELMAKALVNRGITYGQRSSDGDEELKIADYTNVINMTDAPAEHRSKALLYRGRSYAHRGQTGDQERAIVDYTTVINMADAPEDLRDEAAKNLII
jgi:tetratricopeptide (TPR) repeat protein